MKITMSQAFALNSLCEKLSDQQLPLHLSYKIAKGLNLISTELDFYKKQYTLCLKAYAQQNSDGNFEMTDNGNIKIKPGSEEECIKRLQELDSMEFELSNFEFTLEELDGLNFTINDMKVLSPFIKE